MNILMLLSKEFIVDPRVTKEATSLATAGHHVTVIMWDRRGLSEPESTVNGIQVIRIRNTGLMRVVPSDILRNPLWWRKAYKKGMKLYSQGFRFDVVHCHDLDTLQTGVWLKKKTGCKLIYDAHEIFSYMIKNNVPKIVEKYSFSMEKKLVRHVDHLITVNTPLETYFKTITSAPITVVMNCTNIISSTYKKPDNEIFTISYMGVLSPIRMFPDLVDIIGAIDHVKFIIAGKKENQTYDDVENRSKKYMNVDFLGTIPTHEALKKTLESNVVICLFDPTLKIHQVGLPNKVFEAMATGRPVIVTKNLYYSDEFVEKEHCGIVVPYDPQEIKKAIITLRDNPLFCEELGKNGLTAAKEKYNWDKQKVNLLKIYEGFQ